MVYVTNQISLNKSVWHNSRVPEFLMLMLMLSTTIATEILETTSNLKRTLLTCPAGQFQSYSWTYSNTVTGCAGTTSWSTGSSVPVASACTSATTGIVLCFDGITQICHGCNIGFNSANPGCAYKLYSQYPTLASCTGDSTNPGYLYQCLPSSTCSPCPSGQYQPSTGQTGCLACPTGQASTVGQTSCNSCQAGQYQAYSWVNSNIVTGCGGTTSWSTGSSIPVASACTSATTGIVLCFDGVSEICHSCNTGYNSVNPGCAYKLYSQYPTLASCTGDTTNPGYLYQCLPSGTCSPCPAGQYQSSAGAAGCVTCPTGQYQPLTGQTQCNSCVAGQYQSYAWVSTNIVTGCGGTTTWSSGSSIPTTSTCTSATTGIALCFDGVTEICHSCPAGSSSSNPGCAYKLYTQYPSLASCTGDTTNPGYLYQCLPSVCTYCPAGQYQSNNGQTGCTACPSGQTSTTGQTSCSTCTTGYYYTSVTSGCVSCSLLDAPYLHFPLTTSGNLMNSGLFSTVITTVGSPSYPTESVQGLSTPVAFFNNPTSSSSAGANYYTASIANLGSPLTISFWFKTVTTFYVTMVGLYGANIATNDLGIQFDYDPSCGCLNIPIAVPSMWTVRLIQSGIKTNTWYHVALTISSSYTATLYVNGVYQQQATGTGPISQSMNVILGSSGDAARGYYGYLSDFQIFFSTLNSCQVSSIYNRLSSYCPSGYYFSPTLPGCFSCTNFAPSLQFAFTGNPTNTGSFGSVVTTVGSPTYLTANVQGLSTQVAFFNNPTSSSSAGANYYTVTTAGTGSPLTISFWFNTITTFYVTMVGLYGANIATNDLGIQFDYDPSCGCLNIPIAVPSMWTVRLIQSGIKTNTWYHVALTISSTYTATLYVNGVYQQQATGTGPISQSMNVILGSSGDAARGYYGYLSDFNLFYSQLNYCQIIALYNRADISQAPTLQPTSTSMSPSLQPTSPSSKPTVAPTSPTHRPTHPTNSPTVTPSTVKPSYVPSKKPSRHPSLSPSSPSQVPSFNPTAVTKYLAAFTTTQAIHGANQSSLVSTKTENAFLSVMQKLINANPSGRTATVAVLSVIPINPPQGSLQAYGYVYNITYVVLNGAPSHLTGAYQNLSNVISVATASNVIAASLMSTCSTTGCGLPQGLTVNSASTSMTGPTFIQTPTPTTLPTIKPSYVPTWNPSIIPSSTPSSLLPTSPSLTPSLFPSSPTLKPSKKPSLYPSVTPTRLPTLQPSVRTLSPTIQGQCFCDVKVCLTFRNVTHCSPGASTQVYH